MTHTKANKSKILTLILGLATCFVLMLGIAMVNPADTARAEETDPRTVVSTITATSNIEDIIGFGKSVVRPSFNIEGDVPAQFSTSGDWQKKTATGWEYYSSTAFTEGTYRYKTQIRIDGTAGTTHVLDKNGITVTVNDVKWADNSKPQIYDTYSFDWVFSKEYEVLAPAGTPLDFVKNNKWDIDSTYINQPITAFSVADGAVGGTKPYAFSKVSGPEWIVVAADGAVSGTPTAVGANADLVIKVTDSAAEPATKEITLRVGNTYVLPADREVISVIRANSNIGEILGYGKSVVDPSFTFTEGTQAKFSNTMGKWYKEDGTAWKRYEEATFTEGIYMYSNQIRVEDEYGRTHVLNKDGVYVYIDGELCADNQKPDAIYDDYSYIYVGTAEHEVVKAVNDELVPVTDLEKVYNETAQEPTFGGTLVRDTDFEVSYAVKGTVGGLDSSGKPVDAGTYVVTVTGKGAYSGSFTKEFVINKAAQTNVPVGLIANPISCREGSGTIDGVTDAMEYRKVGDADYTKCAPSKITGLAAGEYQIRYAENDNYLASDDVSVTIAISHNLGTLNEETPATCINDGMKAHYYCSDCGKFFDESKNETTEAALTILATGVHTFGTLIEEKPATCIEGGMKAHYKCTVCGKFFDADENETTETALTIPATGVHTFGTLIEETPATCIAGGMEAHYKCTGCGKYFDADKNETTEEALKTPVSPYYGHNFGRWVEEKYATCQTPGRKGYKHCSICNKDYDASNTEITDSVIPVNPDGHELGALIAEVPATCKDPGEKAHRDCNLCGKHCDPITRKEIADLTIPATGVHNYGAWVSNGDGTHTRTCTNGSHSETENCSGGTATCENKAVCSVCGVAYGDKLGHDWGEVKYTWTSDNTCKAERVCKHDSAHIESETVTAMAEEIKAATCKEKGKMKYTATFTNTAFAAQVKEVDIDFTEHTYGDLIPEVSPTTTEFGVKEHKDCTVCGKHFDKDGNEITELRIAKIGTHNVVINGESEFYADGESVTVTAEDKEGKVFKGWQDESGKIISTEKSYIFTVSAEKTLTAVYEDAPAAKKGLSGGAIAGIVIGSVLLAGIGGFAIFWFAVKKKTFADLGVALKKGFTAMGNGIKTACRAIGNFFKTLGAKIKALFTKKK